MPSYATQKGTHVGPTHRTSSDQTNGTHVRATDSFTSPAPPSAAPVSLTPTPMQRPTLPTRSTDQFELYSVTARRRLTELWPPARLRDKIPTYRKMLRRESQYRDGQRTMLLTYVGDGLQAGGVWGAMMVIGGKGVEWVHVGMAAFAAIEILIAVSSSLLAASARSNAFFARQVAASEALNRDGTQKGLKRLARSARVDLVSGCILLTGLVAANSGLAYLFGALCLVKALSAWNKFQELGAWHAIKFSLGQRLGGRFLRRRELIMGSDIQALESSMFSLIFGVTQYAGFLGLYAMTFWWQASWALTPCALAMVLVGCAFSFLPRHRFVRRVSLPE